MTARGRWIRGILLVGLFGWPTALARAQVSPGPLARAHRDLEGNLKCTRCHAGGGVAMESRCIACHGDIGWLREQRRGVHGTAAARSATCASCHPDHAGLDFALIQWVEGSAERFDHRRAGWSLERSHATLKCTECHQPENRVSPAAKLAVKGRSNWTGLEATCQSCHDDIHRGALGSRCPSCHDAGRWTVTPGFSHDTTSYPLTGRHVQVKCAGCHEAARLAVKRDGAGRPIPVYRPVSHSSCAACHDDVHQGSLGANCSTCHTTRGFTQMTGTGFDHNRTGFPLRGRHAAVACGRCHRDFTTERGRRPAATSCAGCHAPDPHAGTATIQGQPADCAACHDEKGFSPSTFPVDRHRWSAFPLEGRHAAVTCGSCHGRDRAPGALARVGTSRVILRPPFSTCATCHTDPHGGQLAGRAGNGECAECHAVAGWTPSRYDRSAHAKLRLPLEGKHAEISCGSCHTTRTGLRPLARPPQSLGTAGVVFAGIEIRCPDCHVDPHEGRYAEARCAECHSLATFRPAAVNADVHDRFPFRLRGAHRATPCWGCHQELAARAPLRTSLIAAGGTIPPLRFGADSSCSACHQSAHGDQFAARKDRGRCDACHGEESFRPATRFDHEKDGRFALGKGHQRLACAACHPTVPVAGGAAQVIYRPLSGQCESCHKTKPG